KNEHRVPLTPQGVEILVRQGIVVLKEANAGIESKYCDEDYAEAGAVICSSTDDVYKCDLILKIGCVSEQELVHVKEKQVIFSTVPITAMTKNVLRALMKKRVTAVAYEFIHDLDGYYPILRSMNEIAGTLSVLVAAECLNDVESGKGVLLGGITGISPAEVVVLGANTAGEFAARAALGLGATVKIFDSYMQRLVTIQEKLSQRLFTSNYHESVLRKALLSADVVIGAIQLESDERFVLSQDMIQTMKPCSVIVDLCMSQGGCFATSKATTLENPTFSLHKVIHYCVPNIASKAARTASIALSNILMPMVKDIAGYGTVSAFFKQNYAARQGVYIYNGILTNPILAKHFGMTSKDIDLLSAAF
ncbi:MAG: alanine dehydrogenase, partial [Bacteroidales bacterium]|nr:alanine dehydrogenase [Bacteroidales bacterium]